MDVSMSSKFPLMVTTTSSRNEGNTSTISLKEKTVLGSKKSCTIVNAIVREVLLKMINIWSQFHVVRRM